MLAKFDSWAIKADQALENLEEIKRFGMHWIISCSIITDEFR